ncbi:hypothetical protein NZ698_00380 [Chryseobacterium sp. PBS4-4]|uniref:Uncharacterized protein n=1 Tax=Chryseobacterium edaphi TaxID=2976532 RepID=A0ABT2W0B8_9FLAO|nr:hypothetical protein [Chryseobacterium edaphi]MCU7615636.1 hypothetical protein [Chryseobacterium edaphi]
MSQSEMFPLTAKELEEIIKGLKARLEDDSYQEEWVKIHDELMIKEKQLKQLTINDNIL